MLQEDEYPYPLPMLAERFNDLAGRLAKIIDDYEGRFRSAGVGIKEWICIEDGAWLGWHKGPRCAQRKETHKGPVYKGSSKWWLAYSCSNPEARGNDIQRLHDAPLEIRALVVPSLPKLEAALRERLLMLSETLQDAINAHSAEKWETILDGELEADD